MDGNFLDSRRLLNGSWRAFERDVARLMIASGFEHVRLVGGSGDHGGDVVAVKNGELWVIQCKFTSDSYPSAKAAEEVVEAAKFYGARRLVVATSRHFGPALTSAIERWARLGIQVEGLPPETLSALVAGCPEYPPGRRDLRPYQEDAVLRLTSSLRETGRAQLVLATGLGKTVVMAEATARLLSDGAVSGNRVLVLADKRELVDQLQREFWLQLPKSVATHQFIGGERPTFWEGVTFATVQTVLSNIDHVPEFGLIWVDEAHHIGSDSFRRVLETLRPAMLGGATATPWRGDSFDIDVILGQPVVRIGIEEGLRNGFLCDADYRLLADNIDWEFVRKQSKHEYSLKELNTRLLIPTRDDEAAKLIAEVFAQEGRRSLIIFCASVEHAKFFAAALKLYGFRSAHISGELSSRERDRVMMKLRVGAINAVTTVDLFNEGVDVPDVDMLAFMRVTHSRRIFVQQLGRGLRLSANKHKVVVLDFVSDLRRISEVVQLQRASAADLEHVDLAHKIVQFRNAAAGKFMTEWLLDQADLYAREGESTLAVPQFNFPPAAGNGSVQ